MQRRAFNKTEKQFLFIQSNGLCVECGKELPQHWHGDHVIPYSKGGETKLTNGQALCPECNLKKSNFMNNKTPSLRQWQEKFYLMPVTQFRETEKKSFLLHAGVGSGKTFAAILATKQFFDLGFNNLIIVSPSKNVERNWMEKCKDYAGIDIKDNYKFLYDYWPNYKGISITYQSLNKYNINFLLNRKKSNQKTIVILDEVHHIADDKEWGAAIELLCSMADFILMLTGTPYRSDYARIPFVTYVENGIPNQFELKTDFSYSYANSIRDEVACPISFSRHLIVTSETPDGHLKKDHSKIYNQAIDDIAGGHLLKMFTEADKELNKLRDKMPNAAGLVVVNSIYNAKLFAKQLKENGFDAVAITSDENDSKDINNFKSSNTKWVVTVKMISEGVDIPRLRIIVYAGDCTTHLFIMQVAGRVIRNRDDEKMGSVDHGYFYLFEYEPLTDIADKIEDEIRHIIEDQEKEFIERKKGTQQIEFLFNKYDIQINGNIRSNAGQNMTFLNKAKEQMTHEDYMMLERTLAIILKQQKEDQTEQYYKADEEARLRADINKTVGQIYYRSGKALTFDHVHNTINNEMRINSQKPVTDINLLKQKLEYAKQWLGRL